MGHQFDQRKADWLGDLCDSRGLRRQSLAVLLRQHLVCIDRDDRRLERARHNSKKPKALAKLSKALKGRVQSPATIEAVRRAAKAQQWSDSRRKKIAAL